MDSTQLRIILLVIGLLLIGAIYLYGRPRRPHQGKRVGQRRAGERVEPVLENDGRDEPGEDGEAVSGDMQTELELLERTLAADRREPEPSAPLRSRVGARASSDIDRIVTLFVAAREGEMLHGSDVVVAAEKAGLAFGDMGIFHRMVDGRPDQGPIFSVASMVKPGSFDMARIPEIRIPGLSFFMTLPGPLPALDAWETMLPAAQRMAELLDARVLDEQHNALGRQRIAHLRDQLRAWDRKHGG